MVRTLATTSRDNVLGTGVTTASATQNWLVGSAGEELNITEIRRQITARTAGVYSKLYVKIVANSTTASSTILTRKNVANGTLTVTIGAGATGVFEDSTNSDTVAAGDEYSYRSVTGAGGTLTISAISTIFNATTNCVSKLVMQGYAIISAGSTFYTPISGARSLTNSTESIVQNLMKIAGTAKNGFLYISGNARTTLTTWTLRKNGGDTSLVLSAAAGVTGFIEDTTNTVSVAVDDKLCWKEITGAGTETLTYFSHALDYETTTNNGIINYGTQVAGDLTLPISTTEYYTVGGGLRQGTEYRVRRTDKATRQIYT